MSSQRLEEFPDVHVKLQKPAKVSAFEQQKAHAEAKRKREAAETAAVYEDFVKSFDRDDDDYNSTARERRPSPGRHDRQPGSFGSHPAFGGGSGRRHFGVPSGPPGMKSGPGSLGPALGFGKKRAYEGFGDRREREDNKGRLGFDDQDSHPVSRVFNDSDGESEGTTAGGRAEEKAIAKPTLRLANLPPGTSPAVIKALIPPDLTVENVKIIPPGGPAGTDRKSLTAIVTLGKDTAASDIDAGVSALQNRYLGYGFYLSLHRPLSSAAISSSLTSLATSASVSHPFGAKPVPQPAGPGNGPVQMGHGRGFAPPSSYGPPGGPLNRSSILHVPVGPPKDIKKLRMIHKVIESIMEHGPEFEALLMSRPDVQKDEKWAWIWDARSEGGVWYRYRLWEIITGAKSKRGQGKFMPLFDGSHAWKVPDRPLPYEYQTRVDEFVSDSEYNSSDDEDFDDELNKPGEADLDEMFLNPIEKSKLVHLLARLPTSLSRLRSGDIARVTTFAITHANRGSDEIVDMIISNVERPFSSTLANPHHRPVNEDKADPDFLGQSPGPDDKGPNGAQDTSAASLIGLYVVSDILSSSSTSGIRHAWRYRQLFENALRSRKVFEGLGSLGEKLQWGRLRAEKWKRSVNLILSQWEGWCVFPAEIHESLLYSFENPPALKKEEKVDDNGSKKGRWKTVDATAAKGDGDPGLQPAAQDDVGPTDAANSDAGAEAPDEVDEMDEGEDTDASEYTDDEDLDLEYLDEEDIDGEPILESGIGSLSMNGDAEVASEGEPPAKMALKSFGGLQMASTTGTSTRKRMRAVDMFAEEDSEGKE